MNRHTNKVGTAHCTPGEQHSKRPFWTLLDTDRSLGVLVLAGGVAATYYFILCPILAAAHHEAKVSLSVKGVMLSPVALGIGVFYIALGPRAPRVLAGDQKPTAAVWIIMALVCAADSCLYFWLKNQLMASGYVF
jgi:hypothetical protein